MLAAHRLRLAFLLLIAAFVVLVGFAAAGLAMAGQAALALLVAGAGVAGVAAGVTTWLLVRREEDDEPAIAEPEPIAQPVPLAQPAACLAPRRPVRVQAMPVARLPPEYVAAVTRGMRARTSALRAQTREMHH